MSTYLKRIGTPGYYRYYYVSTKNNKKLKPHAKKKIKPKKLNKELINKYRDMDLVGPKGDYSFNWDEWK